jgi:hypothetical protein
MREAADIVRRRGARFVEAPFTGSKKAAEKGELLFYVGGDEMALQEARPILEASGKDIMFIGEIGQATAVKIATNIITAGSIQAAAEALALVYQVGLPLEKLVEAMQGNSSHSKTLAMKLPKMIETNFEPHFSVKHMLKDIQIASRMGLSYHLELAVVTATRDRLLEQMQRGYGDDDYSSVARKYFADIRPANREEAGLELFEQQAAPGSAPLPTVPPFAETPQQEQTGGFIPVLPETASQQPGSHADIAATAPEFTPISGPEEHQPQAANNNAAAGIATAPDLPEENVAEQTEPRRGFLSRLLRRESDLQESDY